MRDPHSVYQIEVLDMLWKRLRDNESNVGPTTPLIVTQLCEPTIAPCFSAFDSQRMMPTAWPIDPLTCCTTSAPSSPFPTGSTRSVGKAIRFLSITMRPPASTSTSPTSMRFFARRCIRGGAEAAFWSAHWPTFWNAFRRNRSIAHLRPSSG